MTSNSSPSFLTFSKNLSRLFLCKWSTQKLKAFQGWSQHKLSWVFLALDVVNLNNVKCYSNFTKILVLLYTVLKTNRAACFLRFLGSVLPNFHLTLLFPLSLFCAIFILLSRSGYCEALLWKKALAGQFWQFTKATIFLSSQFLLRAHWSRQKTYQFQLPSIQVFGQLSCCQVWSPLLPFAFSSLTPSKSYPVVFRGSGNKYSHV